ncbi:MAG TPA: hypothetical protein DCZ94_04800 [Lentisphaeria bacterium]|nr:MAG: hypothetical protein A2X48_19975 [Lentisphaerae bacterium GWF2_49_21]HBC86255.1 hypothetical protein [Lentisphaeria bacterium]
MKIKIPGSFLRTLSNLSFARIWQWLTHARGGWPSPMAQSALFATVFYMGCLAFSMRMPMVQHNQDIGHADSAAYALQARGLVLNGSLKVPYVSVFFQRGPSEIWRYDDHWPPMLSLLLAPMFWWSGVDAVNAHAVCVGIGAFLLPLLAAWLALSCCRRVWAALLVAALMFLNPLIFSESLRVLSDVLVAAVLAGYLAALFAARRRPWWFLVAGVFLAGAFYTKGSQLQLLVLTPLLAAIICGTVVFRSRWFYAGLGIGVLLIMPWWITMWLNYGSPLHSTQNYVSSFFGIDRDWDRGFYAVYWDRNLPKTQDRFNDKEAWSKTSKRNLEIFLRSGLLGTDSKFEDWPALGRFGKEMQPWFRPGHVDYRKEVPRLPAPWHTGIHLAGLIWGLLALLVWPAWLLVKTIRQRSWLKPLQLSTNSVKTSLGAGSVLILFVIVQSCFIVFLWSSEIRFTLLLMPMLAVLGCLACQGIMEGTVLLSRWMSPARWRQRLDITRIWCRRRGWIGALLLCIMAGGLARRYHVEISDWQRERMSVQVFEKDYYPKYSTMAQGLQKAGIGGDAVIMTRNPWELLFYMPPASRGVGLPYASPDVIFSIARYYGVTHFINDCRRPGLDSFLKRGHPALTRITADGPFPVYKFDATLFKEGELADLDSLPEKK